MLYLLSFILSIYFFPGRVSQRGFPDAENPTLVTTDLVTTDLVTNKKTHTTTSIQLHNTRVARIVQGNLALRFTTHAWSSRLP